MRDLLHRIDQAAPDAPVLTEDELLRLESYLKTHKREVSMSEMQRAARGDMALRAKINAEKEKWEHRRFVAEYNRRRIDALDQSTSKLRPPARGSVNGESRSLKHGANESVTSEGAGASAGVTALAPFEGCKLEFWPDRVELMGNTIARATERGNVWVVLKALRKRWQDGGKSIGAEELGKSFLPEPAPESVAVTCVSKLRKRIAMTLNGQGIACHRDDVVMRNPGGYRFGPKVHVVVHDAHPGESPRSADSTPGLQQDDPDTTGSVPAGTPAVPAGTSNVRAGTPGKRRRARPSTPEERTEWILKQLARKGKLGRQDVERQFHIGPKTAERTLARLTAARKIERVATPKPGHYRLRARRRRSAKR